MGRIQRRIRGPLAVAAVVSVGAVAAYGCSSSTTQSPVDAGQMATDASPQQEAAASSGSGMPDVFVPLGCPVPDALTGWTPPAYVHAKHDMTACTAQDILDYSTACLRSALAPRDCPVYRTMHPTCAACIEGHSDTDVTWGPLIFWPNGQTELNTAGCLELLDPGNACAAKVQALDQCSHAACDATCGREPLDSQNRLYCTRSAYAGPCMSFSIAAVCEVPEAGGTPAALCQNVASASFPNQVEQMAKYFCGGGGTVRGGDSGVVDAPSGSPADSSPGGSDAASDGPRDAPPG